MGGPLDFFGLDKQLKEWGINLNDVWRQGRQLVNEAANAILAKYGIPITMEQLRAKFGTFGLAEKEVDTAIAGYLKAEYGVTDEDLENASVSIGESTGSIEGITVEPVDTSYLWYILGGIAIIMVMFLVMKK